MSQEIIISIAILSVLIITVISHAWIGKLLTFKMDESQILKHFQELPEKHRLSTDHIAEKTALPVERIIHICHSSSAIAEAADLPDHWHLK